MPARPIAGPREEGAPGIIRGPDGQPVVQLKGITMGREPASGMDRFYQQLDALTIRTWERPFDSISFRGEKRRIRSTERLHPKNTTSMSEVHGLISHPLRRGMHSRT